MLVYCHAHCLSTSDSQIQHILNHQQRGLYTLHTLVVERAHTLVVEVRVYSVLVVINLGFTLVVTHTLELTLELTLVVV